MLRKCNLNDASITEGFWRKRMDVNRKNTLPIEHEQCEKTGRIEALKLNWKPGMPNQPHIFWDSDIGKWIEAAGYVLSEKRDKAIEKKVDDVIELIVKSQQKDGYINSHFTAVEPEKRWTNLRDLHELYCAGHLLEGAVAYYEATGKRKFLDAMCRYADYIGKTFGREKGQKRGYCGHEEIELALVKLFHATGEKKYLTLAKYFVDERGSNPYYFDTEAVQRGDDPKKFWFKGYDYYQAHEPVRKQKKIAGHAVRAMYLYCAMADIAAETKDKSLLDACKAIWDDLVQKKMHITGGIGPTHANEGFTTDYDLPNESAYLETCAAIGLVLWAYRMFNAEPHPEYTDVMEKALFNGVISGVSYDGKTFFYGNPLASKPGFNGNGAYEAENFHYRRSEWFGCACCPPNIARILAYLPSLMYSMSGNEIYVHLFATGDAKLKLDSQAVSLRQKTEYPWNGKVSIEVLPEKKGNWTLSVRIPGWCRKASLTVNGKKVPITGIMKNGYAKLARVWEKGDKVELDLDMPVERIEAHPSSWHNCGRVALQRGPIVYCLEEVDNGKDLEDISLPRNSQLSAVKKPLFGGIVTIKGKGLRRDRSNWGKTLYSSEKSPLKACSIKAIPYFLWANRKPGEMLVWIRERQ